MAVACCGAAGAARADGPGVGTPAIVAVGDSASPGEAGRWASNTNGSSSRADDVQSVVVLIGANDYGFADIVPSRSPA